MAKRVAGSLKHVLRVSRVAWYYGDDGTRAYVEMPYGNVRGLIAVNGKKIINLRDDGRDEFSPDVREKILSYGVALDAGWSCREEAYGMEINEAMRQSGYHHAVRHHDGRLAIQTVDEHRCTIFVDGEIRWTVKIHQAHTVIEELGLSMADGWYPVEKDLFKHYQVRRQA